MRSSPSPWSSTASRSGCRTTRWSATWRQWDPGVTLRVLHTDYASIVRPILGLVDELRAERDCQIVVLIPMVVPEHVRYRLLHNQIDLALAAQLRRRTDVVVARVPMPIQHTEHRT